MQLIKNNPPKESGVSKGEFVWTGKIVDLVEMIFAICEDGNINKGDFVMTHFVAYVARMFSIDIKDFSSAYIDIKHRKSANESRTYFLERISKRLNQRMD